MHEQIMVKVNTLIDKGIAGIVSALSDFPNLETVESCEGNEECGPWVCFRYGTYWKHPYCELANFVLGFVAPHLSKAVGDDATVRIQATPAGNIYGELFVRPGAASRVEAALRDLSQSFNACQHRNWECCGGKFGTLP